MGGLERKGRDQLLPKPGRALISGDMPSVTPSPCSAASSIAGTLSSHRWPRRVRCERPAPLSQTGQARGWEAREGDSVAWFRMNQGIIDGSLSKVPLSSVADWTHGIARPFRDVVADPNPNLTVQLFRRPAGEWVGTRAQARWRPAAGLGAGSGVLLDIHGEIGRVSMSVILMPFPQQTKLEPVAGPAPASN
jgi:hypothetical protein